MKTVLITGASKGIGLEFTRQYLQRGDRVIAASRSADTAPELAQLHDRFPDCLSVEQLDVGDEPSRRDFQQRLSGLTDKLDVLINNAGIIAGDETQPGRFGALNQEDLSRTFLINSIAPLMMVELVCSLLECGTNPLVVNISSNNGSIGMRTVEGKYGYCASKAALNMISKILSIELAGRGVIVIALHPGWVKTPMTRHEDAPLEPSESIQGMLQVIDSLDIDDSGRFLDWKGRELPW